MDYKHIAEAGMRIGVFSDIHGNVAALDAVISDMREAGVEIFACAGDLVVFGPRPVEVLQRLNAIPALVLVRGNTDRWLGMVRERPVGPFDERVVGKVRPAVAWTIDRLPDDSVSIISGLPGEAEIESEGVRIRIGHASPGSDGSGIDADTDVDAMFEGFSAHAFACGHTHRPLVRKAGDVVVVNDGSAGYPYDGVPRPSWALLDVAGGRVEAGIRRVDYDRGAVMKDIAAVGMPMGELFARRIDTAVM